MNPFFTRIYNQALAVEGIGYDQLCGVGYRKALEFLIKDYCISKNPDRSDEIKKKFLGTCIDSFVTDPNTKSCAKRATWLGNDETHYNREWTALGVQDLKTLIQLTLYWISSEILTKQYEHGMKNLTETDKPK